MRVRHFSVLTSLCNFWRILPQKSLRVVSCSLFNFQGPVRSGALAPRRNICYYILFIPFCQHLFSFFLSFFKLNFIAAKNIHFTSSFYIKSYAVYLIMQLLCLFNTKSPFINTYYTSNIHLNGGNSKKSVDKCVFIV